MYQTNKNEDLAGPGLRKSLQDRRKGIDLRKYSDGGTVAASVPPGHQYAREFTVLSNRGFRLAACFLALF